MYKAFLRNKLFIIVIIIKTNISSQTMETIRPFFGQVARCTKKGAS